MNLIFNVDKDSSILAVRLKVVASTATSANGNATADDVYIATLVSGAGSAVFTAGATKPTALSEPDLLDIPSTGIPSGNYSISTTEDDITGSHSWDVVNSDITITNTDVYTIIDGKATKISSATENAIIIQDSDGDLSDSGITIENSTDVDEPSNSDVKIATSKLLRTWLASLDAGYGSSAIGVRDTAGYFTGTNVETVLAEIGAGISRSIFSLAAKTCTALATYYANSEIVRAATTPIQDSSGNSGIGIYRFQYVFENATVATPSTGVNWAVDAIEVSSPENAVNIPVPENGDSVYSGGTAGYAYFYMRVKFVNQSPDDDNTEWAYLTPGVSIAEPELLADKIVEVLGENGTDAQKVNAILKSAIANSPTAQSLQQSALSSLHTSGTGAPTGTPTALGQTYVNETNGDIYGASYNGSVYSWVLTYDAT